MLVYFIVFISKNKSWVCFFKNQCFRFPLFINFCFHLSKILPCFFIFNIPLTFVVESLANSFSSFNKEVSCCWVQLWLHLTCFSKCCRHEYFLYVIQLRFWNLSFTWVTDSCNFNSQGYPFLWFVRLLNISRLFSNMEEHRGGERAQRIENLLLPWSKNQKAG